MCGWHGQSALGARILTATHGIIAALVPTITYILERQRPSRIAPAFFSALAPYANKYDERLTLVSAAVRANALSSLVHPSAMTRVKVYNLAASIFIINMCTAHEYATAVRPFIDATMLEYAAGTDSSSSLYLDLNSSHALFKLMALHTPDAQAVRYASAMLLPLNRVRELGALELVYAVFIDIVANQVLYDDVAPSPPTHAQFDARRHALLARMNELMTLSDEAAAKRQRQR